MVTNAKTRPTCCCCRCRKMLLLLFNSLIGYYTSFLFQHFNGVGFYITNDLSSCIYCCSSLFYLEYSEYIISRIFNRLICAVEIKMARVRDRLTAGEPVGYERPKFGYRTTITTPFFFFFCYGQVKWNITLLLSKRLHFDIIILTMQIKLK